MEFNACSQGAGCTQSALTRTTSSHNGGGGGGGGGVEGGWRGVEGGGANDCWWKGTSDKEQGKRIHRKKT